MTVAYAPEGIFEFFRNDYPKTAQHPVDGRWISAFSCASLATRIEWGWYPVIEKPWPVEIDTRTHIAEEVITVADENVLVDWSIRPLTEQELAIRADIAERGAARKKLMNSAISQCDAITHLAFNHQQTLTGKTPEKMDEVIAAIGHLADITRGILRTLDLDR